MSVGTDQMVQRARAMEMLTTRARQNLMLCAPVMDKMPQQYPGLVHYSDQYFAIKHCRVCNPPPEVLKCRMCDQEFAEKWEWQVHVKFGFNEACLRWAKRKEKVWGDKVGLDA